jgi:predicted MPP superfamily phosphohydrolase
VVTALRPRSLVIAAVGLFVICLGLAVWAVAIEPGRLVVKEVDLLLPTWPRAMPPLTIAVVSDLHTGAPHIDPAKVDRIVSIVNQRHPDLVVLLGDFIVHGVIGGGRVEPEVTAARLEALRAPLGVFAVLGNHDWWYDGQRVARALQAAGIVVLEDEAVRLRHRGHALWLVGLADFDTRTPDPARTTIAIPHAEPIIALTHNPDVFPLVPPRVAITLAGHTHGGQVYLPLIGRPIVPSRYGQRYAIGHIEEEGRHLFVTSGIATSIIPVRFLVPPEIVIARLKGKG